MCMGSTPSTPAPPPVAPPPIQTDVVAEQSRDEERRLKAKAAGSASTILTGPSGASGAQTTNKTLLGA